MDFESAQGPIQEATSDDRETDMSAQGFQAKSYFYQASGHLGSLEIQLTGVQTEAGQFDEEAQALTQTLRSVEDQLGEREEARQLLREALTDLEKAGAHNNDTALYNWQATGEGRYLQNEVAYSGYLEHICADRAGIDVSFEARQLSHKVDNYLNWNVARADGKLDEAVNSNAGAIRESGEAKEALTRLVSLLDPDQE